MLIAPHHHRHPLSSQMDPNGHQTVSLSNLPQTELAKCSSKSTIQTIIDKTPKSIQVHPNELQLTSTNSGTELGRLYGMPVIITALGDALHIFSAQLTLLATAALAA